MCHVVKNTLLQTAFLSPSLLTGSVIVDTAKFSFLLFEFFVPYTVGFWIIFGGSDNAVKMVKNDWRLFNDLTFSVFSVSMEVPFQRAKSLKKQHGGETFF